MLEKTKQNKNSVGFWVIFYFVLFSSFFEISKCPLLLEVLLKALPQNAG